MTLDHLAVAVVEAEEAVVVLEHGGFYALFFYDIKSKNCYERLLNIGSVC